MKNEKPRTDSTDYADGKKFAKVNNDRIENRMDRKHLEPDNRLY